MKIDSLYRALRLIIVFLIGALLVGCEDGKIDPEIQPDIIIDASCLDFFSSGIRVEAEPSGGTFTQDVRFTTTDNWSVSITGDGSTSWISIQPTSGSAGQASITVSVTKNDSELERQAEVKIVCGSVSKSFKVVQEGRIPTVFNVSSVEESGIALVSYDSSKKEVVLEVPENQIPKVGDIICSGRTKEAPYGFLGKVESVSVSNTKSSEDLIKKYVRTGIKACSIYALFKSLGIEEQRWIEIGKADASFTDEAGHSIEPVKDKEGYDVFKLHRPLKLDENAKIDYTYELSVPRCSLYIDTVSPFLIFGYDVLIKNSETLHLRAYEKLPFSKKGELIKDLKWDRPSFVHVHEVQLGPVPLVITTQYMMTVPYEYTFSAQMDMDAYKRVSYHHMGGYYNTAFDSFTPLEGSADFLEIIEGEDEGEYQPEYSEREYSATLEGKLSIGVDFGWSIGLYGGNLDDDGDISTGFNYLAAGVNGGVSVSDKMSLGDMIHVDEVSHNTVRVVDKQEITGSVYGKVWATVLSTNVLGAEIQFLTGEKKWDLIKIERYSSFFFPYYSELKVNSITRQNFLNVSGKRHKPMSKRLASLFEEKDYGLCLESYDGMDYWVFSLAGHPIDSKTGEFSFDIPVDISNLRRNVQYTVYPYSKVANFLQRGKEKMACRDGFSFTLSDDGQLSTACIDNVPGAQL